MGSFDNRPLYALTIEEFIQLLDERIVAAITNGAEHTPAAKPTGRLVYGLKGIRDLFGVSHLATSQPSATETASSKKPSASTDAKSS